MALNDLLLLSNKVKVGGGNRMFPTRRSRMSIRRLRTLWGKIIFCLLLVCLGTTWFAYQLFLVPQANDFAPVWQNAQWIQTSDSHAPVAYFRYVMSTSFVPDGASVTIAANQTFRLIVNNIFIGTNERDFLNGDTSRSYIFDVHSALQTGTNVVVVRVANLDQQQPSVRANIHTVVGSYGYDYGTGPDWKATSDSRLVYPFSATRPAPWSSPLFNSSSWPVAENAQNIPAVLPLTADPQLYTLPLSTHWISAGVGHQAYYTRTLSLSDTPSHIWLRFAASGPSNIFVNGHLSVHWSGNNPSSSRDLAGALSYLEAGLVQHTKFVVGIYDIAPYIHSGVNTISVYVAAPDIVGLLGHVSAAMSLDALITDRTGHDLWQNSVSDWHASTQFVPGWEQGDLNWPVAVSIARPTTYQTFYLIDSNAIVQRDASLTGTQSVPFSSIALLILCCFLCVIGLWFLLGFMFAKYHAGSLPLPLSQSLATMSLAYLPALAVEILLIVVAREPRLPNPFPYTSFWGSILLSLVLFSYLSLWLNKSLYKWMNVCQDSGVDALIAGSLTLPSDLSFAPMFTPISNSSPHTVVPLECSNLVGKNSASHLHFSLSLLRWLRLHWALLPLVGVAIALIFSSLSYEPLWQDELVSYYVAKNSLIHGFPMMPSGFIYPKAELFAYMLGMFMRIFGDQGGTPRMLSAIEFVISIPLLYFIGTYFFGRRVAWLAAAMLTLSPFALIWGSQVRMYEQAQICVLIVFYVFYHAARSPRSKRWPYLAIICLVIMYFTHEETFIAFPGLVLGVFLLCKQQQRLLPAVFYNKHWWIAALMGAAVIGMQLLVVKLSHPPVLGTDQSMRPNVQINGDGIPFYISLLFSPRAPNSWLTLDSIIATLGCIWAFFNKNIRVKYCALFLTSGIVTMVTLFTLQADRYFYPLFPLYLLLTSYTLWKALRAAWRFARPFVSFSIHGRSFFMRLITQPGKIGAFIVTSLVCASVLLAPMLPISNFSASFSHWFGLPYYHRYVDYNDAGSFIKQNWHKGDIVISISPDIEMYYYVGQSNYYFSVDRALFTIEQDGHIVNTSTAAIALLDQSDLNAVLAKNGRIWLVSDRSTYENTLLKRFVFPKDFHIAYEGSRCIVYLRGR